MNALARYRLTALIVVAPVILLGFQNCAPGFSAQDSASSLSSSSTSDQDTDPAFKSAAQTVNSVTDAKQMTFSLGESGATLLLTIEPKSTGYSISAVKVVTATLPISFAGLHVWINNSKIESDALSAKTGLIAQNSTATYTGSALSADQGTAPALTDTVGISLETYTIGNDSAPSPTPTPAPVDIGDGVQLYANYCANCHGELSISTKKGRSAIAISAAIQAVPDMNFLGASLTDAEIAQIAEALK